MVVDECAIDHRYVNIEWSKYESYYSHSWFEIFDENNDCSFWNVNKCGNGLNHTLFHPKDIKCQTGNNINSMWVWMTSGKEKCMFMMITKNLMLKKSILCTRKQKECNYWHDLPKFAFWLFAIVFYVSVCNCGINANCFVFSNINI